MAAWGALLRRAALFAPLCCLYLHLLTPTRTFARITTRTSLQSKNWADILVPRARDNHVAIEMVAKEIARRVALKQEEAAQARESLAP